MKTYLKLGFAAVVALSGSTYAVAQTDHASHHGSVQGQASSQLSEGEIRKVDKEAKKITIKHGELKNLDMPAMTMVFQVTDPAMLERVKQGDKVSFVAEKVGGQFTVTQIEAKQ